MNRYYRIGLSLALILAFVVGSAVPVAAQGPRHDDREQWAEQQAPARQTSTKQSPSQQGLARQPSAKQAPARHAPGKYAPVVVRDRTYFFLDGLFYRSGLNGYIAVQAPRGAIVVSLPIGACDVIVGGSTYFTYGGVYYRPVPSGYEVVQKPYMGDSYCSDKDDYKDLDQVMVITRILNVRQGPGVSHPVVYKVYRDDVLNIIGEAPGWIYVSLPQGGFGWVMKQYVTPMQPAAKG